MKSLLAIFISSALVVSGYSQTRNVLVNSNNAVVSPTNFWSADASNARTGLGLGTAATNPASAFQPSSGVLSNLASSNAVNLTNLRATNIIGTIPASNIPSTTLTNITGTLAITQGGTGATNAASARTNLGATTIGNALFTATNSAAAIDAIGISTNFSDQVLSVSNIKIGSFTLGLSYGFVVPTSGQTLSVGGTNVSTGTPAFYGFNGFGNTAFSAAEARTNLGLNTWTTNTNSPVFVGTNGEVVSPTNFWQVAPISTTVQYQTNVTGTSTNAATNSRNLFLFSLTPSVSGVTNTVTLPTNTATTFEGDRATIIHLATNSANTVTAIRQLGAATNLITLNQGDEAVLLMYRSGAWVLSDNISYVEPIFFSGTNAAANAAASRTNLGLGSTNTVTFQGLDVRNLLITFTNGAITFEEQSAVDATRTNMSLGKTQQVDFGSVSINQELLLTNYRVIGLGVEIDFEDGAVTGPLQFLGATNAPQFDASGAATTRTNLGLGATNNVTFNDVTASGTLTATSTVTAKTNLVVEGFVNYTAARTNNTPTNTPNFAAHAAWIEVKVGTNSFFLPAYQ